MLICIHFQAGTWPKMKVRPTTKMYITHVDFFLQITSNLKNNAKCYSMQLVYNFCGMRKDLLNVYTQGRLSGWVEWQIFPRLMISHTQKTEARGREKEKNEEINSLSKTESMFIL